MSPGWPTPAGAFCLQLELGRGIPCAQACCDASSLEGSLHHDNIRDLFRKEVLEKRNTPAEG